MNALQKLVNLITLINERFGLPFILLMLGMLYQLIKDVLFWDETRDFYDQRGLVVSGAVVVAFWVYKIWKKSEYRLRTIVASLLVINTISDTVCVYAQIPIHRGMQIPIDILWMLGLVALRFGKADKNPFPKFTYKEM